MPFMFAIFDFAERAGKAIWANPVTRWIAIILTGAFIHRIWLAMRDRKFKRQARIEVREEITQQIEDHTNERVEDAREAARSTDDLNAEQLRQLRARDPNNRSRLP
jgi:hypothetical protein